MIQIIPHKMVFGGDCIAKINGKTVFISGALPNETLEIDIIAQKKDYDKAIVTRIISPSPRRVNSFCDLYGICGGCNFQFADYDFQLELKRGILEDIFNRAFCAIPSIETIFAQNNEYRSRFQFHLGGLKKRNGNAIVALPDCPCAASEIRSFLQSKNASILQKYERLHLFADKDVLVEDDNSKLRMGIEGQSECTLEVLGIQITFDVRGFFQSNIEMLKKIIPLVTKGLGGKHLLDMYCGVGTLSLFTAEYFETITLVEHNKQAIDFACDNFKKMCNRNKKAPPILQTFAMSGEKWVKKVKKDCFDAVIIDPPRSGIEKSVLQWLCNSKIPTIRYLSCDPATLARDSKHLFKAGYHIRKLYLLDFYPHTSHIECLAYFEKTESATLKE